MPSCQIVFLPNRFDFYVNHVMLFSVDCPVKSLSVNQEMILCENLQWFQFPEAEQTCSVCRPGFDSSAWLASKEIKQYSERGCLLPLPSCTHWTSWNTWRMLHPTILSTRQLHAHRHTHTHTHTHIHTHNSSTCSSILTQWCTHTDSVRLTAECVYAEWKALLTELSGQGHLKL